MFRWLHIWWVGCVILLGGCTGKSDVEEGREDRAKHSRRAERTAKRLRENVLEEINKLQGHQWAGDYYAGDGLGVSTTLTIAPESGYVFEWHGCLGLYDRNYGAVLWTNDRIRLSFTFANQRKGLQGIAPEFVAVSWDARCYLIPSDDVHGFCNDVNQGSEPRRHSRGSYLLRKGDEVKVARGVPKVPDEYRSYLLSKPVEAGIISVAPHTTRPSVAEWKFKDTPVTIDAGANQGLRVGMELLVTDPQNVESLRLTKVEENRAEGIISQIDEDTPGPRVGWRVSTRAPWHDAATGNRSKD